MKSLTAPLIVAAFTVSGCASMANRPTQQLVEAELSKERKVVTFTSDRSVAELENQIVKSGCGPGKVSQSGVYGAGPGVYVPVSSSSTFTVDRGSFSDGTRWVALRNDGVMHMVASGVVLSGRDDGGSSVRVLAADARKVDLIRRYVEDGTVFCHWREFGYLYD